MFMPPPPTIGGKRHYVFGYAVRPSVRCPLTPTSRDAISLYLWVDFNETCHKLKKSFQGQRSKVKITARWNSLLRRRHTFRQCGVETLLFGLFFAYQVF